MPLTAVLGPFAHHFPAGRLTNADLVRDFPSWTEEKILQKTGIDSRGLAVPGECASDLMVQAAEKLFERGVDRGEIDFILLCTQSPDYFLPTTACIVQDRLGIPTTAGALDFNLGCSGFVYGLGMAKGLIETGQARNVLLLTGDTYSKFIHPGDKSVRTLFGDAGAATIIRAEEAEKPSIGPFVYGTDGRGAKNLIVPTGGLREPRSAASAEVLADAGGNSRSHDSLYMNGPEIFNFTLQTVPTAVRRVLEAAGKTLDEIDLFVFHQANEYMLEHLRKKSGIPKEKFPVVMKHCGNTVSATIPIALEQCIQDGKASSGMLVMVLGFGVGYSWAGALIRLP